MLVALTTQEATLIAAVIAASAASLKLIVDAVTSRGAEARAAHREVLSAHLGELGTAIHQVVAGAVLLHNRAKLGQRPGEADTKAGREGSEALKRKRLDVKYPLDGTNDALRTLSRSYDWAATFKGDQTGDEFIDALQKLGRRVDRTIARSYAKGRPPTWWDRRRLKRREARVRAAWKDRFGGKEAPDRE